MRDITPKMLRDLADSMEKGDVLVDRAHYQIEAEREIEHIGVGHDGRLRCRHVERKLTIDFKILGNVQVYDEMLPRPAKRGGWRDA